jgi:hypothetical protein
MPPSSFFTLQADESPQTSAEEIPEDEYILKEAPIPPGRLVEHNVRGRTLKSTLHPLLSQGQAWITEKHVNTRTQASFIVAQGIYLNISNFNPKGASTSLLPEELALYPFDIPHRMLTHARKKVCPLFIVSLFDFWHAIVFQY